MKRLLVTLCALLSGCINEAGGEGEVRNLAPEGATNFRILGNQFVGYEWRGSCFMMTAVRHGAATTPIDCKQLDGQSLPGDVGSPIENTE